MSGLDSATLEKMARELPSMSPQLRELLSEIYPGVLATSDAAVGARPAAEAPKAIASPEAVDPADSADADPVSPVKQIPAGESGLPEHAKPLMAPLAQVPASQSSETIAPRPAVSVKPYRQPYRGTQSNGQRFRHLIVTTVACILTSICTFAATNEWNERKRFAEYNATLAARAAAARVAARSVQIQNPEVPSDSGLDGGSVVIPTSESKPEPQAAAKPTELKAPELNASGKPQQSTTPRSSVSRKNPAAAVKRPPQSTAKVGNRRHYRRSRFRTNRARAARDRSRSARSTSTGSP